MEDCIYYENEFCTKDGCYCFYADQSKCPDYDDNEFTYIVED